MRRMNVDKSFDVNVEKALGSYVYVLCDPTKHNEVFYVGKGGGNEKGNERVLAHFDEAEKAIDSPMMRSKKVNRILDIWAQGQPVKWSIVRHGLNAVEAFHTEASLVDLLNNQGISLTNSVRGQSVSKHGWMNSSDVYALAAPLVNPNHPYGCVLIFNVHKAINEEGKSPYDATRSAWNIPPEIRGMSNVVAVGLVESVSRCVIEIDHNQWQKKNDRWEFAGAEPAESELLNRNFTEITKHAMGYIQRGNYVAVSFDGRGSVHFLRGSKNKMWFRYFC